MAHLIGSGKKNQQKTLGIHEEIQYLGVATSTQNTVK